MKTVNVEKVDLIAKMTINLTQHKIDYADALEGYWKTLTKELQNLLASAMNENNIQYYIKAEKPKSYVNSYEKAIEMVKWETSNIIELTPQEFSRFVLDDWEWKESFLQSQMLYNSKCG